MTQRKFFKIVRGIKLYGIYNYICIAFTEKRQFRGRHLLPENHRFEIVPVIDFSITYRNTQFDTFFVLYYSTYTKTNQIYLRVIS